MISSAAITTIFALLLLMLFSSGTSTAYNLEKVTIGWNIMFCRSLAPFQFHIYVFIQLMCKVYISIIKAIIPAIFLYVWFEQRDKYINFVANTVSHLTIILFPFSVIFSIRWTTILLLIIVVVLFVGTKIVYHVAIVC